MNWFSKYSQIDNGDVNYTSRMHVLILIQDCLKDIIKHDLNDFTSDNMERLPFFHQKLQELAEKIKSHQNDLFSPSPESEIINWEFEMIHNCICHTLLGFYPNSKLATALHDWSGDIAYGESQ